MRHSPWQFHLVDVPPRHADDEARSAVVARLHHCIADGIALASVLLSLTDDHPDVPPEQTQRVVGTNLRDPRRPGLRQRVTEGSADVAEVTGVDPLAPRSLRQAVEAVRFGWRVVRDRAGPALRRPRPPHPAQRRPGRPQERVVDGPLDLGLLKRVAADALTPPSTTSCSPSRPVRCAGTCSRTATGRTTCASSSPSTFGPRTSPCPPTLGNRFGHRLRPPARSPSPTPSRACAPSASGWGGSRRSAQAASTFAIIAIVGALPSWAHRLAVRVLGAKSSAIVTNVPGPREPVFLAGARLERLVFWVPQAGTDRPGREHPQLCRRRVRRSRCRPQGGAGPGSAHPRGRGGAVGTGPAGAARRRAGRDVRGRVRLRPGDVADRRGAAGVRPPLRRPRRALPSTLPSSRRRAAPSWSRGSPAWRSAAPACAAGTTAASR